MKKPQRAEYESPTVESVDLALERGFAQTQTIIYELTEGEEW